MDKRSHPIPTHESNSQPASGWMPAVADSDGCPSLAASQGLLGLREARRHRPIALLSGESKRLPWTLNGIPARLNESHHENRYGAAFDRLNALCGESEPLEFSNTPDPSLANPNRLAHAEPTLATRRRLLRGLVRTVENWLIHRQGRRDLRSLDDHLLKDIGISREDIGTSRQDAFWKAGKPF